MCIKVVWENLERTGEEEGEVEKEGTLPTEHKQ